MKVNTLLCPYLETDWISESPWAAPAGSWDGRFKAEKESMWGNAFTSWLSPHTRGWTDYARGVEQEHTYCSNERDAFMPGAGMRFGLVAGGWGREDNKAILSCWWNPGLWVLCGERVEKPERLLPAWPTIKEINLSLFPHFLLCVAHLEIRIEKMFLGLSLNNCPSPMTGRGLMLGINNL